MAKVTIIKNGSKSTSLPVVKDVLEQPKERRREFHANVPLSKLVPFYGNDPDRVDHDMPDFQELVDSFKAGAGVRGPARCIYDPKTGMYYIVNGHRTAEASRVAGFDGVDVLAIYAFPGETAQQAQETLFALDNKNRPYKGKAMLRTAIITKGRVLMSTDIKRVWGIIQKYTPNAQDLDWMSVNAAPDLIKITEQVINYVVLARQKDGETSSFAFQKALFVTAMGILKRKMAQRETRDYVQDHLLRPNRILENALADGTVPDAVLTAAQKNQREKAEQTAKKKAKQAKARAAAKQASLSY